MEENKNTCAEDIKEQEAAEAEAEKVELEQEATEEETEEKLSGKEKRKIKKAEAEIEKLNATIAEEQDKYLRLYAEYDNFRKRSAREREGVYQTRIAMHFRRYCRFSTISRERHSSAPRTLTRLWQRDLSLHSRALLKQ